MTSVRELFPLRYATIPASGLPVVGYLLRLDGGRHVLVDTGPPADMIGAEDAAFHVTGESHVLGRLARLGLGPEDVDTVVVTHLDPDHAGANDAFPRARFVVQRAQYEHARTSGLLRYEWLRAHWDVPGLRYELVDGDVELAPGLTLIESGGHVPGHQAVMVELPETGTVLLAIDAIPIARLADPETRQAGERDVDAEGVVASTRKLVDLARERGAALVVYGHDAEQWASLRDGYR